MLCSAFHTRNLMFYISSQVAVAASGLQKQRKHDFQQNCPNQRRFCWMSALRRFHCMALYVNKVMVCTEHRCRGAWLAVTGSQCCERFCISAARVRMLCWVSSMEGGEQTSCWIEVTVNG